MSKRKPQRQTEKPEPAAEHPVGDALEPSHMEEAFERYRVYILGGLAIVVLGVVAGILLTGLNEQKRIAQAQAFSAAETIEDLDKVIAEHGGSIVAGNAMLRKAGFLEDENKTDEARTTLLSFVSDYDDHPRQDQALLVLARLAEDEGNDEQAREFYSRVPGESSLKSLAQLRLGDLEMQAEEFEQARVIYDQIPIDNPGNPWISEATKRSEQAAKLASDEPRPTPPKRPAAPKPEPKPAPKPEAKPTPKPEAKPAPKPEAKPAPKPEAKPAPKPEAKPAPKPEAKPAPKPEAKPAPKPEAKPAPKPEAKPAPKPEPKPAPKPEAKPAPKPEAKPAPKPEPKPAPKPEPKPTPKPEPKPAPEPEPKPTPKPEAKPEPEPAPKPAEPQGGE